MTLEDILNEPVDATQVAETKQALAPKEPAEAPKKTPVEVANDPDMVWDDDEEATPDQETDKVDEDEPEVDPEEEAKLNEIEERNKWMKGRIAPVKQKLSKAEEEIAKLRAENEALKAPPKKPDITPTSNVDEIIANDPLVLELTNKLKQLEDNIDNLTQKEYLDLKLDLVSDLKMAKRELSRDYNTQIINQQRAIEEADNRLVNDLTSTILGKKEVYPDIEKAYDRVNKNAENLHLELRRSIIMDEDKISPLAADLINVIGNDKQAMSYLIAQSKLSKQTGRIPTAAIEYIGRLKTKIQEANEMPAPDVEETINKAQTRKPGIPKTIKSHSVGEPEDLSEWASQAVKAGKRPW